MKKILFVFLLSLVLISNSFAQKNIIKANLFSVVVNTGSFFYERVLAENKSLQFGLYVSAFDGVSGWGVSSEYRFYPSQAAPVGFFLSPFLRVQNLDGEIYPNLGLLIGNQWVFGEAVSLDLFIGPTLFDGYFEGSIGVRAGLAIGIAF